MNSNNNWRNNRRSFNNFGGWHPNLDQGFPEPSYYEEMDEEFIDNKFGWQYGRGGGPPQREWGDFNPGPGNWGPPPNFGRSPPNIYSWGRGFGPTGPPIQNPKRNSKPIAYLLRCGVAKERLNNLPKDFFHLITPEHCGLCDVNLESFNFSRAHYASKGHSKKQNKWMSEHRNLMSQHPRNETPLKSRDLYCELCDVQITSKVHADSHYEGKPHRAIVEGRKKPKNISLLSKNMTGRVEQLIRRERKFIKYVPEVEKTEEELAQAKAIPPELYCDICKTSVTCTEQMTMHLNGKKHLTKEKQHILKMMKCDGENDDKEDAEEAAEKEAVDNVETEAKEQNEADDKYDWGNGSGAWDEEEKQEEK